jgi:HSP20 family protein
LTVGIGAPCAGLVLARDADAKEASMQPEIIQSMHDQVRAIYRAFTNEEIGEDGEAAPETDDASDETIAQRFAELETIARAFPSVMASVPPFKFVPPVDVIVDGDVVIVEIALPGVDREAIKIERAGESISISGVRHARSRGSTFHAEIPRGPFLRTIPLPFPLDADPRIDLVNGVLRIHLPVAATSRRARPESNSDERGDQRR